MNTEPFPALPPMFTVKPVRAGEVAVTWNNGTSGLVMSAEHAAALADALRDALTRLDG